MSDRNLIGREALLSRPVHLIGGTLPQGTRLRIESPARAGCFNVQVVGGPQRICELPRDAFELVARPAPITQEITPRPARTPTRRSRFSRTA